LIGLALCAVVILIAVPCGVMAEVTGQCSNCHTMHNSQDGELMATYGADGQPWKGTEPLMALVRGTCLGCHGQGTADNIITLGASEIPQVYHTGATDLAGGNFRHIITGGDGKGHNVVPLGNQEDELTSPPGYNCAYPVSNMQLTCAGNYGCHGYRYKNLGAASNMMKGTHHKNPASGKCDVADELSNSYRFLLGIKGLENPTDKWENKSPASHNEYFGATAPMADAYNCFDCHAFAPGQAMWASPSSQTISGFCCTCHDDFHTLEGIGGSTTGPFTRHPSDLVLPATGEFAGYTTYDVLAPVGRTAVPDTVSSAVTPGADVVTCLSCHKPHASPYDDILRWDYQSTTYATANEGCVVCHTQK